MKLITKFDPGDPVWVMKRNKPYKFVVNRVDLTICGEHVAREMYVDSFVELGVVREYRYSGSECFSTMKELLDSFLVGNVESIHI